MLLGNSAQAYVYSGIAFRLIDHLGILVDGQRYAASVNLSDEDIEIRSPALLELLLLGQDYQPLPGTIAFIALLYGIAASSNL